MNKNSLFKPWLVVELPKLYYLFFLCCLTGVYAQNTVVKGIVTDDNGPLPGVTVKIKSKPDETLTDEKGNYVITAAASDILVFTYVGFKTKV